MQECCNCQQNVGEFHSVLRVVTLNVSLRDLWLTWKVLLDYYLSLSVFLQRAASFEVALCKAGHWDCCGKGFLNAGWHPVYQSKALKY